MSTEVIPNGIVNEQKDIFEKGVRGQKSSPESRDSTDNASYTRNRNTFINEIADILASQEIQPVNEPSQEIQPVNKPSQEIEPVNKPSQEIQRAPPPLKRQDVIRSNLANAPAQAQSTYSLETPSQISRFSKKGNASPLYNQLEKEATKIFNYVIKYKSTIKDDDLEKLYKYYVYFKILYRYLQSGEDVAMKKILDDTKSIEQYENIFYKYFKDKTTLESIKKWSRYIIGQIEKLLTNCVANTIKPRSDPTYI